MLISKGANVNQRDLDDMSPFLTSVFRNQPEIVKLLLESGAKLDFKSISALAKDLELKMSDEVYCVIENFKRWERIKFLLKLYKNREKARHFPKELMSVNSQLMRKIFSEYA